MSELFKQFVGTAGIQLLSKAFAVFLGIVYARILGPESYGYYGFVLSIITVLAIPVVSGYPNLIIREIAIYQTASDWSSIRGLIAWSRICIFVVSSLVIFLSCVVFQYFNVDFVFWALLLIPLRGLLSQQGAVLNGFKYPMLAQFPLGIVMPIITFLCLTFLYCFEVLITVELLVKIIIFSSSVSVVLSYFFTKIKVKYKRFDPNYKLGYWSKSLVPFSVISFVSIFNAEFPVIFLGFLSDNENVAYYKVAFQGVFLCAFGLSSINSVIMPRLASLMRQNQFKETQDLLTRSVRISVFVAMPIIIVLLFFGGFIITTIFGDGYSQSYLIMLFLLIGQMFNVFFGPVGSVLYMTKNEKTALRVLSFSLVINIILVSAFSFQLNGVGAAIAVSISMAFSNVAMAYVVYKKTGLKTWLK